MRATLLEKQGGCCFFIDPFTDAYYIFAIGVTKGFEFCYLILAKGFSSEIRFTEQTVLNE